MIDFWENIIRYPKFFIVSLTGLVLTILSPLISLIKKATNRGIYVILIIASIIFIYIVLNFIIEVN